MDKITYSKVVVWNNVLGHQKYVFSVLLRYHFCNTKSSCIFSLTKVLFSYKNFLSL